MCKRKGCLAIGFLLISTILLTEWVQPAQSQEKYPTRAITVIVPFTPGGSTDMTARITAPFLSKKWGVPVNVINKPGGNTIPAQVEVYNSPPDGYTVYTDGQPTSTLVVVKDLPFKIMDRTFIASTLSIPNIMVVPVDSPYKTMNDAIADVRKDPENFTWGSLGGVGGTDLVSRQFLKAIGVDFSKTRPVMAKGGASAAALAAGGHVKVAWVAIISALPLIQGGTARVLSVTSKERSPLFPEVLTTAELGHPNVNFSFWTGFSGPPQMPSYIVAIWDKALREIGKDPEYVAQTKKAGYMDFYHNASDMKEYFARESEEVADLYGVKKK
jgi:tripartite-type tricarboxylate transporter receptor subunit TctC